MDALFSKTLNILSNMLDYRAKRHVVVMSNVTNIDTPNYKPSDISFKNELGKANKLTMETTDPKHMPPKNPNGLGEYETKTSEENVKLDTEMVNLAENHLMYNVTVEMLARKFKGLQTVLKETK